MNLISFFLYIQMTLWLQGLARSGGKLKALHIHNYNSYDHQNLQKRWLTFRNVYRYSHMTLYLHVLARSRDNVKNYFSTTTISMGTKLGRVVTYNNEFSFMKLHDPSITWFFDVTWKNWFLTRSVAIMQVRRLFTVSGFTSFIRCLYVREIRVSIFHRVFGIH